MDTEMKRTLHATKEEKQYDACAKRLLGNKSILANILMRTIDEFKGMSWQEVRACIEGDPFIGTVPIDPGLTNKPTYTSAGERIVGLNTISEEHHEGRTTFDIITYVRMHQGLSRVILHLEAQKSIPSGYKLLNRGIFYVCRLLSSQKERDFHESNYDDIKPVYSIWICMNAKQCNLNYIHLINECVMGDYKWQGNLDLFNLFLIGVPNSLPPQETRYELHRLLAALFSLDVTEEERNHIVMEEYHISESDNVEEELNIMCNLSQGVKERGIEEGREEGRKEGREEGREAAHTEIVINMYKSGLPAEQIAYLSALPICKVQRIIEEYPL